MAQVFQCILTYMYTSVTHCTICYSNVMQLRIRTHIVRINHVINYLSKTSRAQWVQDMNGTSGTYQHRTVQYSSTDTHACMTAWVRLSVPSQNAMQFSFHSIFCADTLQQGLLCIKYCRLYVSDRIIQRILQRAQALHVC